MLREIGWVCSRLRGPANLGQSCGSCGGNTQCNGQCSKATPADLGASSPYGNYPIQFSCCWIDSTVTYGGDCSPGYQYQSAVINKYQGGGSCAIVAEGGGSDCRVTVRYHNNGLEGARCELFITQRRACD